MIRPKNYRKEMLKMNENEFYEKIKNWDFSQINYTEESLTNWDLYDLLRKYANEKSVVLDFMKNVDSKLNL